MRVNSSLPACTRLPLADIGAIALSGALLASLVENGWTIIQQLVLHRISGAPTGFLWMVPLYNALAFGLLAVGVVIVSRVIRKQTALQLLVTCCATLAAFILLLLGLYGKVHQWTLLLVALGSGIQTGRWAVRRTEKVARAARVFALVGGTLVLIPALLNPPLQRWLERREFANLGPARPGAPNVLLIILDTVRAASLSLYGYSRATTPNLERLASRGVVFTRAVATSSWTLPSHATMFTGRYPHELAADWIVPMGREHATLAEVFRENGYQTAGFVANLYYTHEESGLARGFTRYEDFLHSPEQVRRSTMLGQFLDSWRRQFKPARPLTARKAARRVTEPFLAWLHERKDRPFFAFLNYFDAHEPYLAPREIRERFSSGNRKRDNYDASIASLDVEIGRLIDSLERRGLLDSTLIVITSDHGEQMGEHGLWDHGNSLYLPSLHVPLMIMFGDRLPNGSRRTEVVSLRDLPQTIAHLARLHTGFPGTSLSLGWENSTVAGPLSPALSEVRKGIRSPPDEPVSRGDMRSLAYDSLHLIVNGDGVLELYDFIRDPGAAHDLSPLPGTSDELMMMRRRLQDAVSPLTGTRP